jgi:hypothetical protein
VVQSASESIAPLRRISGATPIGLPPFSFSEVFCRIIGFYKSPVKIRDFFMTDDGQIEENSAEV